MSTDRWQEVKAILDAALDRSPQTRGGFIAAACGADERLRAEVESYLEYEMPDEDVLEEDVFGGGIALLKVKSNLIGRRFGNYKLQKELGAGGMGIVFLGERCDGAFEQTVAVKLLGQGLFSKGARERFLNERRILARLRHKNIASLIDGGATDEGIPFLIMEYVEGVPVTRYVREKSLSSDRIIELFLKICDAVSYAHRNLIVHRDLKPANILVAADGEPKLLDFGIAKLTSGGDENLTQSRHLPHTPEYASPEQISGGNVTTTSDVYALGVILYELLTGARPFNNRNNLSPDQTARRSSRLGKFVSSLNSNSKSGDFGYARKESARKLTRRELPKGDLGAIILKTLKPDPDERYQSVEQFSEDIRRFRKGLPVSARPESPIYRAGKFIRRNRLSVGAAVLIFLIAVAGIFATMRQAYLAKTAELRAEQRLADLRGLTGSLLFELNDEIGQSSTKARFALAEKSQAYLHEMVIEAEDDPSLRRDLALAYLKLGDLQGRPYHSNIGKTDEARESYKNSLELVENLFAENPTDPQIKFVLARAYERYGYLLGIRFRDWRQAGEKLEKSVKLREEIAAAEPENSLYQAALADSYLYLSDVFPAYKQNELPDEILLLRKYELARKSLDLRKKLHAASPGDAAAKRALAVGYQRMANAVITNDRDKRAWIEEKLSCHKNSLRLREELASSPQAIARDQRQLADQLMMMSDFLVGLGQTTEAEKNLRRSKEIFHSLTLIDPFDAEAKYDYGNALWRLGKILATQKRKPAAREELTAARNTAENIAAQNPSSAEYRSLLNLVINDLNSL